MHSHPHPNLLCSVAWTLILSQNALPGVTFFVPPSFSHTLWLAPDLPEHIAVKCSQITVMLSPSLPYCEIEMLYYILTRRFISLLMFSQTQLGNQHLTANVLEVNASQTHRQSTPEASSCPSSVIPFHQPTLPPSTGSSPALLSDDLGPSCLPSTQGFSGCLYKHPLLAPDSLMHSHATGSLRTDSSLGEDSSQSESESSTAILAELQLGNFDTTDCSETPSPTWVQRSAVTDGTTLATPAATHVIILPPLPSLFFFKKTATCLPSGFAAEHLYLHRCWLVNWLFHLGREIHCSHPH